MTKDTDPDLRFMALNDLEKEMVNTLTNVSRSQLLTYSEILVRCLDDEFSEVRTQALKCFESISFRLCQDILPLVRVLINKKPKKISITSTIYTMALHNILKGLPHIEEVYVGVINILLPEIMVNKKAFYVGIDYIEILSDLVEYVGKFMTKNQMIETLLFLNDASFNADTIIAKKSIMACHVLIKNVDDDQMISTFTNNLIENFNSVKDKDISERKMVLLSIFAASLSGNPTLMYKQVNHIWEIVIQCLNMNFIGQLDEDYEIQQKNDMVRLEAIMVLVKLFRSCKGDDVEALIIDVLSVCQCFVSYDPYNDKHSDEESFEEINDDSFSVEDDYSEYEQDDDDSDNDNCSWKLRSESLTLLRVVIQNFPIKLPLIFKNSFDILLDQLLIEKNKDVVVKLAETLSFIFGSSGPEGTYYSLLSYKNMAETTFGRRYSDVSMQTDDDPYTCLVAKSSKICEILSVFIDELHSISIDRIDFLLKLLSNLTTALDGLQDKYVELYIIKLNQIWNSSMKAIETSIFYSALLAHNSIQSFGDGLSYLIDYLAFCMSNGTNHRLLVEALRLINDIFKFYLSRDEPNEIITSKFAEAFTNTLIEKIVNKNLSTEIRLQSLNSIVSLSCEIILDSNKANQVLSLFVDTISTEVLALNTLNDIAMLIKSGKILSSVTSNWVKTILTYILEYLNMSDLNFSALKALKEISEAELLDQEDGQRILISLEKLHVEKMFCSPNCVLIGIILTHVLKQVNIVENLDSIISFVIDLDTYDKFDEILPALMEQLLNQTTDQTLTRVILKYGKPTDLKISKLLAVISVASKNESSIGNILEDLRQGNEIYFCLVFLNQVSKSIDLNTDLGLFFKHFESENQSIVNMAIKTVSTIVSKNNTKYLDELLNYLKFTKHLPSTFKCLSLVLKEIQLDDDRAMQILTLIIDIQRNSDAKLEEDNVYEIAAECLGTLLVKYELLESLLIIFSEPINNLRTLNITIGNTVKYTYDNKLFLEKTSLQLLVKYAELTTSHYIFDNDLIFKQTGISNLNLILNKKPNIAISLMSKIIPNIMETEIKPNKEFIHTQFIGPYKHKIDDGLNYRKHIFDSIYYLFKTLEDNKNLVLLCNTRWALYFNRFFDCGIKDDQSIASVCLLTVLKLFEQEPNLFANNIGDVDIFEAFLARCRKMLNKKVADNAVKQDIEKQNNLVKMMIRFVKKIDVLVQHNKLLLDGNHSADWHVFIKEIKSKFPIFNADD